MGLIKLETKINQTPEICFDLSRSIDLHMESAISTDEKAIEGVTSGLMSLDDEVLWEAKHFGISWNLRVKISKFDRPNYFQDSQVEGIFKFFNHDHFFIEENGATLMKDEFHFECPFGIAGYFADPIVTGHMKKFLSNRNQIIKKVAEGEQWEKYLYQL